ncbi:hypothetical protein GCM10009757_05550 [Streptomyces cheonanensis]|uniref:Uncharacterized protein n=1 Tax=Streptomyces cheonanensis TaxID=312720 RepID=A0ABN2USN7_9ACTN
MQDGGVGDGQAERAPGGHRRPDGGGGAVGELLRGEIGGHGSFVSADDRGDGSGGRVRGGGNGGVGRARAQTKKRYVMTPP